MCNEDKIVYCVYLYFTNDNNNNNNKETCNVFFLQHLYVQFQHYVQYTYIHAFIYQVACQSGEYNTIRHNTAAL